MFYKRGILSGCVSTAVVMALIATTALTFSELGLKTPVCPAWNWFSYLTVIVTASVVIALTVQSIGCLTNEKYRLQAIESLPKSEAVIYSVILPRTGREKCRYALLSATAGVSEEIVFRGLPVFLLKILFPALPIYWILFIQAALFGVAHNYQGLKGILTTGAMGLALGALYVAFDSLFPCMAVHFIADVSQAPLLKDNNNLKI